MDDSDKPVVALALDLAYLRWRNKRRSKKGAQDEPSARARALWFKNKAISSANAAISEAERRLRGIGDDDFERLLRLLMLEQIRLERRVRRGRPRKRLSLMATAMQRTKGKRPSGRPAIGAPEDAAKWVAYMFGLKLGLFMEKRGWPKSAIDAFSRAAKNAELEPARYLNSEVTDREVLAGPHSQGLGPPASLATMAKRLQRARHKHPFLPKQLKPSK